jgi:hypothetical protein
MASLRMGWTIDEMVYACVRRRDLLFMIPPFWTKDLALKATVNIWPFG